MIRRFNFTSRKKINHADIGIRIDPARTMVEELQIPAERLKKFEPESPLFLEAIKPGSPTFKRFELGTCGEFSNAIELDYKELNCSHPRFDLKVVDISKKHGRLEALAEKIRPSVINADDQESDSLLPVNFDRSMGKLPWKLVFDGSGPMLNINAQIYEAQEVVRTNPVFHALVLPEVIRGILVRILKEDKAFDLNGGPNEYQWQWLKWGVSVHPDKERPKEVAEGDLAGLEELDDWIDEVAMAFAEQAELLSALNQELAEGDGL